MNKYIFMILETLAIVFTGLSIGLQLNFILGLLLAIFLIKAMYGSPKHYGKMYKCAIWSYVVFVGLLFIAKADIFVSILSLFVTAYVTSGKSDIDNLYMFKKKDDSKYKALDQFILFNYDDERLLRFENHMKKTDTLKYNLYVLRFKKNLTWDEMEEKTNISRKKINSELDIIYNVLKYNLSLDEED